MLPRTTLAIVLLSLAAAGCSSPPADLDLSRQRTSADRKYLVAIRPLTPAVPINQLHSWEIQVRSAQGRAVEQARIGVDGGMPQHGHGLPTRPQVTEALGDGRYRVDGVKFSMPGWWELRFAIDAAEGADQVTFNEVVSFGAPAR